MPPRSHGMSRTPEYKAWARMIDRCSNPETSSFKNYGARGISVCALWRGSFEPFLAHIGLRPSSRHSIDRIDNEGHYEPGNVRWATRSEQNQNRRGNVRLTALGQTKCLIEWARSIGISNAGLYRRLHSGQSLDQVLSEPNRGTLSGSKLTEAQAREVWTRREGGETARKLGREFGISPGSVNAIGKSTWLAVRFP